MDEIYHHALKLLRRRDFTEKQLRERLEAKFGNTIGDVPNDIPNDILDDVLDRLRAKRFLDDRRYAENFVSRHCERHAEWVKASLIEAGVAPDFADQAVSSAEWPSLKDVLKAKMAAWRLKAPLQQRDAARLFRVLARHGFPEDDIREELEQLQ